MRPYSLQITVTDRPYMDHIVELEPICFTPGDSLEVEVNTDNEVRSGVLSSVKSVQRFACSFEFDESGIVQYIRFTKRGDEASITIHENMPTSDLRDANWNATRL